MTVPHEEEWYKVELYDVSADCTINFFTDDIEDFQRRRFKLKNAEPDTVQKDRATIYDEKDFALSNTYFGLENAEGFKNYLHADELELHFKWIRFKSNFARVAKVKVLGLTDYLYIDGKHEFGATKILGNSIMARVGDKNFDDDYTWHDSPKIFAENSFASIGYLPSFFFRSERKLLNDMFSFVLSERELSTLFQNFTSCIDREEFWAFYQVLKGYPDSPSKIWHKQKSSVKEPPGVCAEEKKYRERIEKGFYSLTQDFFKQMFASSLR